MFKFGGLFNMVGNDMPNIKRGQVQRYDPNQRQEPTRYDPSQRQDPIRYNPNQRQEATEYSGIAGGASPNMKPYQQLTAEELQAWQGYDPNNSKSRATQYANAAGSQPQQPGSQSPAQTPAPSSTPSATPSAAPAQQEGGSIWSKLKDWNTGYNERMEDRGLINPVFQKEENPMGDKPWSVNDIPKESWENYEMGILQNPDNINEQSLMKMAMNEGQLDQGRWNMIKDHIEGSKENPYYKSNMKQPWWR